MATFRPFRGVAPFLCVRVPLLRVVGSILVQGSVSHHIHTRLPNTHSYKTIHTVSVLSPRWQSGMVVGPRERERLWEPSRCAGFLWRAEKVAA